MNSASSIASTSHLLALQQKERAENLSEPSEKSKPIFTFKPEDYELQLLVKKGFADKVQEYLASWNPSSSFKWGNLLVEAIDQPNPELFDLLWKHHPLVGYEHRCVLLRKAAARDATDIIHDVLPKESVYVASFIKETWMSAAKHGSWNVLDLLLDLEYEPSGDEWEAAIFAAASRGNLRMLRQMYFIMGDFSIKQVEGALHGAILCGHLQMVQFLLRNNPKMTRTGVTLAVCKACQASKLNPQILLELLKPLRLKLIARETQALLLKRAIKEGLVEIGRMILQGSSSLAISDFCEAKELAESLGHGKIFEGVKPPQI